MWAGGLAESSIPPKPLKIPPNHRNHAFLTRISPFLTPNLAKTLGCVGGFTYLGSISPRPQQKVFLWLPLPTTIYVAYNSALPSFSAFLCIRVFQIAHLVIWVPLPEECALSCVSKVSALLLGFCSFLPIRNIV